MSYTRTPRVDGPKPLDNYSAGALIGLVIAGGVVSVLIALFKAAVDSLLYVDSGTRKEGWRTTCIAAPSQRR